MVIIDLEARLQKPRTLVVIPIGSVNLHELYRFIGICEKQGVQVIDLRLFDEPNKTVGRLLRNKNGCGLAIVFQEDDLLERKLREAGIFPGYISPSSKEAEKEISLLFSEGLGFGGVIHPSVHAE